MIGPLQCANIDGLQAMETELNGKLENYKWLSMRREQKIAANRIKSGDLKSLADPLAN